MALLPILVMVTGVGALTVTELAVEVSRFISFGEEAQAFLEGLNRTGQPIKKNLAKLLALHDQYGTPDLIQALQRAMAHNAYGASYVENILHQKKALPSYWQQVFGLPGVLY